MPPLNHPTVCNSASILGGSTGSPVRQYVSSRRRQVLRSDLWEWIRDHRQHPRQKTNVPDSVLSLGRNVDQPSPKCCSRTRLTLPVGFGNGPCVLWLGPEEWDCKSQITMGGIPLPPSLVSRCRTQFRWPSGSRWAGVNGEVTTALQDSTLGPPFRPSSAVVQTLRLRSSFRHTPFH